ncbi:MAG TPA: xanthine dehydrogenase family protein subunit M [Vicinamibacterales bacterium]
MIPVSFTYERASSIEDAVTKMAAGGKLIAGGHSLVPLMKLRLSEPGKLIDIARIPGLSGIRDSDGRIEIGATTTHHEVATSQLLRDKCPMIAEAAAEIGDAQVRNRGTIGGSIAHADPAADMPAVMLAAGAEIEIRGAGGSRTVKAEDYFQGFYTVDLQPSEIITAIRISPMRSAAYAKLHQRASHYAIVGVAAALQIEGGVIRSARIGVTGATTHAVRLTDVEAALAGKQASAEVIAAASQNAGSAIADLNVDLHGSADYRRAMIAVFTRRALEKAIVRG